MSNFFNVALLPVDENLAYSCTYLAQTNLKECSTQFLLGENALPHITVCQFKAPVSQLKEIWSAIENMQTAPLMLKFGHIYILPGSGMHHGKTWVGLTVIKAVKLIKLQKMISEKFEKLGIESNIKVGSYSPHLTWARCEGHAPITVSVMPPEELWQNQHAFYLTIGLADINGVYQECLYSKHQLDAANR